MNPDFICEIRQFRLAAKRVSIAILRLRNDEMPWKTVCDALDRLSIRLKTEISNTSSEYQELEKLVDSLGKRYSEARTVADEVRRERAIARATYHRNPEFKFNIGPGTTEYQKELAAVRAINKL